MTASSGCACRPPWPWTQGRVRSPAMPWEVARRGPCWRCSPPPRGSGGRPTASSRRCGTTNRPRTPRPTSRRWSAGSGALSGPDLVVGLPGAYVLGGGGPWTSMRPASGVRRPPAGRRPASTPWPRPRPPRPRTCSARGRPCRTMDDDDWVLEVRREADALRRDAIHQRVAALLEVDPARAVPVATAGVAPDPYDERAVRDLMRALAGGRTGHGCAGGVRRTGADAARGPRHRAGQRLGRAAARPPA